MRKSSLLGILLVVALVALIGTSDTANAFWHQEFNENFEKDPPPPPWPWSTGNGTGWSVIPYPWGPGPYHTWGKEDSTVYRMTSPQHYRSIWCAGLPNDHIPGVDTYPNGMNAWAIWGPFEITEEMVEAGGVFYFWGNIELYQNGSGDNFALVVTDNDQNLGDYGSCPVAFQFTQGTTDNEWWNANWDFANLDSAGDSVSYMPFYDDDGILHMRNEVYIALVFQSNYIEHDEHLGIFVDDFSIGYDDGLFDYDMRGVDYMNSEDTTSEFFEVHINDPMRFRVRFVARGPQPEGECSHVLYIDDDLNDEVGLWDLPQDTIRGEWESSRYGSLYNPLFPITWVPTDTGDVAFGVKLDAADEIEEWSDTNNVFTDTLHILQAQTAPYIIWIQPSEDTDTLYVTDPDNMGVEVIYAAYNSPDYEYAEVSFRYDTDQADYNGPLIPGAIARQVLNGEDSFTWDVSDVDNGVYYLFAILDDQWFGSVLSYAPRPVVVDIAGVRDTNRPDEIPGKFAVSGVFPNPFNPTVEVTVAVPVAGDIVAKMYALDGRMVDSVTLNNAQPGYRKLTWTPQNLSSGMYIVRLASPVGAASAKVIYLK